MIFLPQGSAASLVLVGLVGMVVGSHLATIALRWPDGRSAATGRSACDQCHRMLAARDLVPLLSWIAQRGRCRWCGGRIDPRHPAIEAIAALLAMAMAALLPLPAAVAGMVLAWLLLLLSALDLDRYWLPDRLTGTVATAGIAVAMMGVGPGRGDRIAGAAIGWGVLALVRAGYHRLRGYHGLGGGDPKLFGAIGAWVGWAMLPGVLLIASLSALLLVAALTICGRRIGATTPVPFGPALALAGVIAWIWVAR